MTLSTMVMRTNYMMETMRQRAIEDTLEQFKAADRHYYETCYGGKEVTRLIHELENLGVSDEYLNELDLSIRDEVFGL